MTATKLPAARAPDAPARAAWRTDQFIERVREALRRDRLLSRGGRVLVAVSGGADSMALLYALAALAGPWRLTVQVVHVHHGLRPEADEDAAFVQAQAQALGLPVRVEPVDAGGAARTQRLSIEDAARRLRYERLEATARGWSADAVAVAHTADDQAETVLLRLLRGTGVAGLGGMTQTRPLGEARLIRPLLAFWRAEIEAFLAAHGLSYRDDATNRDLAFTRNRIRHDLLPRLMQDYNPRIREALVQLAEQCRTDTAYLEASAARQWRRIARRAGRGEVLVDVARLRRQPPALRRQLVRRTVREVQGDLTAFEFRHWRELESLIGSGPDGALVDLPGGIQCQRLQDHLRCARARRAE